MYVLDGTMSTNYKNSYTISSLYTPFSLKFHRTLLYPHCHGMQYRYYWTSTIDEYKAVMPWEHIIIIRQTTKICHSHQSAWAIGYAL